MRANRQGSAGDDALPSWPEYIGYDLGRVVRKVSEGADTAAQALGAAESWLRKVGARRARSRDRARPSEPRVQVIVDPRVRARGHYVPARLAVELQHAPRVGWTSTVSSFEDVSRGALAVLQSLQAESSNPLLAVATDPGANWRHIEELAEVSGLADALRQAGKAALRHDADPTLAKLADALEALGPEQRRELGYRFLERLSPQPVVQRLLMTSGFQPVEVHPSELDQLARATAANVLTTLGELGLSPGEIQHVSAIAEQVSAPLVKLVDFYLAPRTATAKLKRYWRLQRIGLTALKIASRPSFGVEALRVVEMPARRDEDR